MSSYSFINALRRSTAISEKEKLFWSDRGTNFVGAIDPLRIDAICVEETPVKQYLYNEETVWKFNSPHASHMGCVWERLIGVICRILDSVLLARLLQSWTDACFCHFPSRNECNYKFSSSIRCFIRLRFTIYSYTRHVTYKKTGFHALTDFLWDRFQRLVACPVEKSTTSCAHMG